MPLQVDHTEYGEVSAFVIPAGQAPIHMVSVQPKCKHRPVYRCDPANERLFDLVVCDDNVHGTILTVFLAMDRNAESLPLNTKLGGCLRGDAYLEGLQQWEVELEEPEDAFDQNSTIVHYESVNIPKWALEEALTNLFLYLHSQVCPLCTRFSKFVESELKEILNQNPSINQQRISQQQYVRDMLNIVATKQDHPHIESYRKDVDNEYDEKDEEVNCLVIRSPEGAMHVFGAAVGMMNKSIGQHGGRSVMIIPWEVYSDLSKMKGVDAPNLRSTDIGRKLSHLYEAIRDKHNREEQARSLAMLGRLRVQHEWEAKRDEDEAKALLEKDRERRDRIQDARALTKADKPLPGKGPSHREPNRRQVARTARGHDKLGKIEEARQHEQNLKEAEAARQKVVRDRLALVRVGELIAGSR
jgi:hypothetical protein